MCYNTSSTTKEHHTLKPKLTPKQEAFIREYLVDFNATNAAHRAGYQGDRKTLSSIGSQNLAKPAIQRRINHALAECAMSSREIVLRLARHARGSMGDFISLTPDGDVQLDLHKALRSGAMANVRYLAHDERYDQEDLTRRRVEISLYDSLAALTQLSRGFGLPGGVLTQAAHPADETYYYEPPSPKENVFYFLKVSRGLVDWNISRGWDRQSSPALEDGGGKSLA
jgi:hypothetical protein